MCKLHTRGKKFFCHVFFSLLNYCFYMVCRSIFSFRFLSDSFYKHKHFSVGRPSFFFSSKLFFCGFEIYNVGIFSGKKFVRFYCRRCCWSHVYVHVRLSLSLFLYMCRKSVMSHTHSKNFFTISVTT